MKIKKLIAMLLVLSMAVQYSWSQECMEGSSDEGVNVVGYVQTQAEYNFLGDNLKGESVDEMDFYFNRVRIGVVGNIPYDFSYYALTELSPYLGGPYILDAFISYNRFGPYAKVTFGQFKSPFGLELSTACHKLHTINRSHVVGNLASPFRDFGLMVSGGTGNFSLFGSKTENLIGYSFALTNGTGLNTPDDNRKKDIIGRITLKPFDFITLGASYKKGKHPALVDGADDDERSRFGFDMQLDFAGFTVQGEYVDGSDIGSYSVGGGCGDPLQILQGSVERNGFYAQAMYMTKWNVQPIVKVEKYDPNTSEIEGLNDIQNVVTYGVNYFFNEWTRLQINYLYRAEENARVEVPNDALLMQLQVVF